MSRTDTAWYSSVSLASSFFPSIANNYIVQYDILSYYLIIIIVLWSQPPQARKEQRKDWTVSDKERPQETAECWHDLWKSNKWIKMVFFAWAAVTRLGCFRKDPTTVSFWFRRPDLAVDLSRGPACCDPSGKESFGFTWPGDEIIVQSLNYPTSCERHFMWDVFGESRGCTRDSPGSSF